MATSNVLERALALVVPTQSIDGSPRGQQLYIISVVMVVVAGIFVFARIGARMSSSSTGGLGVDDLYVVLSLVSSVVLSITEIQATVEGYGNHMRDLTRAQILASLKWFYLAQIFYKVVITFNKMALLAFYLRIFPNRRFRILCYAGLVFIVSSGLAYIIATIFQCTPIAFYWNRRLPGGHCIKSAPFWISYATINIITDFYILILPMPLINKLSLTRRNKYALMAVFAMGGFVCFTTIIRMTTLASSAKGTDFTYGPVPATNWSVIEANTGLICACLPMLKQYLGVIMKVFKGPNHNLNTSGSYTGKSPRSQGFDSGSYKLSAKSRKTDRSEIFGTGDQWGAVDSNITSNGRKMFPDDNESQEHIITDTKGIQMTTDVHWHADGKSQEAL